MTNQKPQIIPSEAFDVYFVMFKEANFGGLFGKLKDMETTIAKMIEHIEKLQTVNQKPRQENEDMKNKLLEDSDK